MVKEFIVIRTGKGCKTETHVCNTALGSGIFETRYIGLGMMVKDARFWPPDAALRGYGLAPGRHLMSCLSC